MMHHEGQAHSRPLIWSTCNQLIILPPFFRNFLCLILDGAKRDSWQTRQLIKLPAMFQSVKVTPKVEFGWSSCMRSWAAVPCRWEIEWWLWALAVSPLAWHSASMESIASCQSVTPLPRAAFKAFTMISMSANRWNDALKVYCTRASLCHVYHVTPVIHGTQSLTTSYHASYTMHVSWFGFSAIE